LPSSLNQFSCIEVANHGQSLVLFTKATPKRQILHIDCAAAFEGSGEKYVQTNLSIGLPDESLGSILDIEIWDAFLAILFEKNLIVVFDLARSPNAKAKKEWDKPVFKAKYADSTETVS
jgi:hypothetical protein